MFTPRDGSAGVPGNPTFTSHRGLHRIEYMVYCNIYYTESIARGAPTGFMLYCDAFYNITKTHTTLQ